MTDRRAAIAQAFAGRRLPKEFREPELSDAETQKLLRPVYRNTVLALVAVGFALNFLDRQILTILMQPVKEELQISDTALGFLSGLAFALFYAVVGVPLARVADRRARRTIMAASMAVWSAATALCGLAQNFVQLALARFGVGIGEGGFTPAGMSLLSDYFPKDRRGTALGFVNIGPMIGTMLGLVIGGVALEALGWRGAFMVAGIPGVLFAGVFYLAVKEPWRGMADGVRTAPKPQPDFWQSVGLLWVNRSYRYLALGSAMSAFGLYGLSTWMPSYLMRAHEMAPREVGLYLGPVMGGIGALGMIAGGWLSDLVGKRSAGGPLLLPAAASVLAIPLLLMTLYSPSPYVAVAIYAVAYFLCVIWVAPTFSLIQSLMPLNMRATGTAWKLLLTNLIGLGLGPQAVGVLSDLFGATTDGYSLRLAMMVGALTLLVPAALYTIGARYVRADLGKVG